jgi:PAS domain S-box-containing protein
VLALAGGSGIIITAQALTGLVVLTALAFHYRQTAASLNLIVDFLRNDPFSRVMPRTANSLGPLAEALAQVIESAAEKTEKIKNEHGDLALKLQLLSRQKRNIEAIIYSIRDAVIVTDAFDRLIIANSACEKLFDFDINAAQNKSIEDFINKPEFVKLILHSRRSRLEHVKHEMTFTDGNKTAIFDCIISCVNDDKGLVCGVVAVLHDMTREKEIAKAKNDFVGHVSHELKTPLASINAYAEMLADGEAGDQETINQFCAVIQDQAQDSIA